MKITEYPSVSKIKNLDVALFDGEDGTRTVKATDLAYSVLGLGGVTSRRLLYRGKRLGNSLTIEQKVMIQDGTFDDFFLGDYWEINGVIWRIADFDYWYNSGNPRFTNHHLVIMPDTNLYTASMNDSSVTTGGYTGSKMYTTNLNSAKATINAAFPDLVLTHKEYLINEMANGYPSNGAWVDSAIDLPNEIMIYGCHICSSVSDGPTDVKSYTNSNTQLAIFRAKPSYMATNEGFWLRDIASATHFCRVDTYCGATKTGAANTFGVRPVFAIG